MAENPTIRRAEARDAEAVAALANMLAVAVEDHPPGVGVMTSEIVRRDLIDAPGLTLLVAERSDDIVGYALMTAAYETSYAARGVHLVDLAVAENARRCGVGSALMRAAAHEAVATGGCYVSWVVAQKNRAGQTFYNRIGGVCDPVEARAIFGPPFDALLDQD